LGITALKCVFEGQNTGKDIEICVHCTSEPIKGHQLPCFIEAHIDKNSTGIV